jgi:transposase
MKLYIQAEKILVANQAVDFRRALDGLCAAVKEWMNEDPSEGIYVFYNKNRNRVKIISRHTNGFILIYKRLDRGKFFVEQTEDKIKISRQQLDWLLLGADWKLLSKEQVKYKNYF